MSNEFTMLLGGTEWTIKASKTPILCQGRTVPVTVSVKSKYIRVWADGEDWKNTVKALLDAAAFAVCLDLLVSVEDRDSLSRRVGVERSRLAYN